MSTGEWHFPGRPHSVLGSISEEHRNAALTAMVREYSALLNRVARSITHDTSEAEDVVQETFLRALRHHSDIAELRDAQAWLIRITWNLALDRKRWVKAHRRVDNFEEVSRSLMTSGLSADAALIAAERQAGVLGLIDSLPAKEREVFILFAVDELSTVEIAVVLKTTDSTIRSRLYRARLALRILVQKDGAPKAIGR
jgi:RNA polymerase sigma-70 factor (ECF subfamily)